MHECAQVITLNQWELLGKQSCIMLFDLAAHSGHHAEYLNYLIKYWSKQKPSSQLVVVTSPNFFEKHISAKEFSTYCSEKNVWFVEISVEEYLQWQSKSKISKMLCEWNIYCRHAILLNAKHCLLMYFDSLQLSIVFGQKSPCSFSGVYFRPSFHYHKFDEYNPSFLDLLRHWRKKILLEMVIKNPQLKTLFCLDEFAVEHMKNSRAKSKLTYLPDPIDLSKKKKTNSGRIRNQLKIESGRIIFLCFGDLEERKGIKQVLQAVDLLSANYCQKICLMVVGVNELYARDTNKSIEQITSKLPIQIITQYQFVPESEVSEYFQLADVVLVSYQQHIGMSGVLLHAALANKPVLASNYGLIGKLVLENCLGITVDTESPRQIADAFVKLIDKNPAIFINDRCATSFVKQHDSRCFSRILIEGINEISDVVKILDEVNHSGKALN